MPPSDGASMAATVAPSSGRYAVANTPAVTSLHVAVGAAEYAVDEDREDRERERGGTAPPAAQ